MFQLTKTLAAEYLFLFKNCEIRPDKFDVVDAIIEKMVAQKDKYEAVATQLNIPWYFVAVVHNLEASLDFTKHLHNGDSLQRRTRQVPAGRPRTGTPPFTWNESAVDALRYKRLHRWRRWDIAGTLYKLEQYNGWGYRKYHQSVYSPYLWSYCQHYQRGKYIADGTFSATAVSRQSGAAVLLRRMSENNQITFEETIFDAPLLFYNNEEVNLHGKAFQRWVNRHSGLYLRVDGILGQRSSDAFYQLTGSYLVNDPRNGA